MKKHAPDEWAAILEKLEVDEFPDVVREAMAQAFHEGFDKGFEQAERIENIRIGYTTAVRALGDRAPKPSRGWDEAHEENPYS